MSVKIRALGDRKARELARALAHRLPELVCSACRRDDFALIEDPDAEVRSQLVRRSQHFTASQNATTLLCTNCGHVMQFADVIFLDHASPEQFGDVVTNE